MATIAEIEKVLDRLAQSMVESDKRRAETERALAESRAETERALAESRIETERILAERRAETERALAESRAETKRVLAEKRAETEHVLAESRAETKRTMDELADVHKETERTVDRLSKKIDKMNDNLGGVNNSIGEIVQMIIIPGVMGNMNALGHNFTMASAGKEYRNHNKETLTEVDLILENCQDVMLVEVKTQVSLKWVKRHLTRMEILRKNESITGVTGKTMYAAVAGIDFDEDALDLAAESGMYLIKIKENEDSEDRIDIIPPEKVGTW